MLVAVDAVGVRTTSSLLARYRVYVYKSSWPQQLGAGWTVSPIETVLAPSPNCVLFS
jgi:hypothetical protein